MTQTIKCDKCGLNEDATNKRHKWSYMDDMTREGDLCLDCSVEWRRLKTRFHIGKDIEFRKMSIDFLGTEEFDMISKEFLKK